MKRNGNFIVILIVLTLILCGCTKSPEEKRNAYLESAGKFVEEEKYPEAAIQFRNALKIAPDDAVTLIDLGEVQLKQKKIKEAFRSFSSAVKVDPANVEAREYLGAILLMARNYDEAIEHASIILEQHPDNPKAREMMSQALFLRGDKKQALEIMEKLLTDTEKPSEVMIVNVAQMYLASARIDDALDAVLEGASFYPASSKMRFLASDIYLIKKDAANALKWAEDAYNVAEEDIVPGIGLARFYIMQGLNEKFDSQIAILKERFPSDVRPYLLDAEVQNRRGDLDSAQKILEKAAAIDNTTEVRYLTAQIMIKNNQTDKAKEILDGAVADDADAMEPRILLARIYLDEKLSSDALEVLDPLIEKVPSNPEVALWASRALAMEGETEKAMIMIDQALKKNEKHLLLRNMKAKILFSQKKYVEVLSIINDLGKKKNAEALYMGAISSINLGKKKEAADFVNELKQLRPDSWPAMNAETLLFLSLNKKTEAYDVVGRALEIYPNNMETVRLFAAIGSDVKGTEDTISKISKTCGSRDDADFNMLMAGLLEKSGRKADAQALIEKAIDVSPAEAGLYHSLAAFFARNDMTSKALDEYESILNKDPDDLNAAAMMGLLYQSQEMTKETIRIYNYILDRDPYHALAANNLAWILAEGGGKSGLDRALQLAQKAKDKYPDEPRIADTLGYVYLKKGLYSNAQAQFTLALEKMPDEPELNYHMAQSLVKQGMNSEARVFLEKALKKDFASADEAKKLLEELE